MRVKDQGAEGDAAMSEVKDLRVALEKCGAFIVPEDVVMTGHPDMRHAYMLIQALVSEGLAACDEWESVEDGDYTADNIAQGKVDLLASILRKAGLLK